MHSVKRLFTTYDVKGKQNYLNSQKKFEIIRTVIYFAISLSLFISGIMITGSRKNLLTIVAVLGCLPACKSTVEMIMFLRFSSLSPEICNRIEKACQPLNGLYDLVFTSYEKNFQVDHLILKDHILCGYSASKKLDENLCQTHLKTMLLQSGYKDLSIKIYKDLDKYLERLKQLNEIENDNPEFRNSVYNTLKSISL